MPNTVEFRLNVTIQMMSNTDRAKLSYTKEFLALNSRFEAMPLVDQANLEISPQLTAAQPLSSTAVQETCQRLLARMGSLQMLPSSMASWPQQQAQPNDEPTNFAHRWKPNLGYELCRYAGNPSMSRSRHWTSCAGWIRGRESGTAEMW